MRVSGTRAGAARRRAAVLVGAVAALTIALVGAPTAQAAPPGPPRGPGSVLDPIDPQNWENPADMTWSDHRKVPGTNWAQETVGSERTFKGAVVLLDYTDQPFLVTQPEGSHVFGNPRGLDEPVPQDELADWFLQYLNVPSELNNGHTINEYWMEDSDGRFAVDLKTFGAYHLPGKVHEYGLSSHVDEDEIDNYCPQGDSCDKSIRQDGVALWEADQGEDIADQFDFIFYVTAGHDESSTWQEMGEMKFLDKEAVTDEFGPPSKISNNGTEIPNWAPTRYVEWSSWQAAAQQWPNAGGGSSTQAESSGQGTYAHEFSHILGIGDNYNNPYGTPTVRAYTGVWEMLSRGSFNGPGGPHTRWTVPNQGGGSMGAHHTLRNKLDLGIVGEDNVVQLNRDALANQGVTVTEVTARAIQRERETSGINIVMGTGTTPATSGDRAAPCPVTDYQCDGRGYNNYTLEVVDRMGADSFTPDSGVLINKTKNRDRAPFIWTIDAHPEDINMVDFVRPDGTNAMITVGDYRQLSDALFKAGTRSGSSYEYVDEANGLHFYVLDVRREPNGVLKYTVAVRSTLGDGPNARGTALKGAKAKKTPRQPGVASCDFRLTNTGQPGVSATYPELVRSDVYRLRASSEDGWTATLPNALSSVESKHHKSVPVYVTRGSGASKASEVTLTAVSESDPSKTATATCAVTDKDTGKG